MRLPELSRAHADGVRSTHTHKVAAGNGCKPCAAMPRTAVLTNCLLAKGAASLSPVRSPSGPCFTPGLCGYPPFFDIVGAFSWRMRGAPKHDGLNVHGRRKEAHYAGRRRPEKPFWSHARSAQSHPIQHPIRAPQTEEAGRLQQASTSVVVRRPLYRGRIPEDCRERELARLARGRVSAGAGSGG